MHMKQSILAAATIGLAALQGMAQAQSMQGVVVELFTSQGCSSCPPADAVLERLTRQPGVIPLALHVDYWDYIGWSDTFAQEKFSNRQRNYAAAHGDRMVYTPQMIVAGGARVKGYDAAEASEEIKAVQPAFQLDLTRQGDDVVITAKPLRAISGEFVVDMIRYRPKSVVSIERGENRGKSITYHNIVTEWLNIGTWSGEDHITLSTRATGNAPVVVIIQRAGPQEIMAGAVLK
jgi:hypothetical protein